MTFEEWLDSYDPDHRDYGMCALRYDTDSMHNAFDAGQQEGHRWLAASCLAAVNKSNPPWMALAEILVILRAAKGAQHDL